MFVPAVALILSAILSRAGHLAVSNRDILDFFLSPYRLPDAARFSTVAVALPNLTPDSPPFTVTAGLFCIIAIPFAKVFCMVTQQPSPPRSPGESERPAALGQPEEPRDLLAGLDAALLVGVPLFAFLLASTAASNSDLWLHLAAGRLIASGQYSFGVDPFSFTTEGVYWANHAWLYDWLLYMLYQRLGGPALVFLKALLPTALVLVMMSIRRPGQSFWLPGAVTALSVLAMSPRMLLLPTVVSYLFLGLTLALLYRRDPAEVPDQPPGLLTPRRLWLLPPLFALWVNLDGWYFLGPLSVALYLLGEMLQEAVGPLLPADERTTPQRRRVLGAVLLGGVGACLLNPHHIHAFTLPTELSLAPSVEAARVDDRLQWFFLSPFSGRFFQAELGGSVAGLAFFPLVLVGAISFVLTWSEPRWGRTLLWLVFFLLAAFNWQLISFFAVVAGPIAVLNCQDFVARCNRQGAEAGWPADRLALDRLAALVTFRWWPALSGSGKVAVLLLVALLLGGLAWLKSGSTNANLTLTVLTIPNAPLVALAYLALLAVLVLTWLTLFVRYRYEALGMWSLGGRFLTLFVGLGLLVAVWPGWLQDFYRDPQSSRRVAWDVEPNPSLVRAAEQVRRWREAGLLPDDARGLNLSHQVAGYWAWFGHGEKTYYDLRLPLFDDVSCVRDVADALTNKDSGAGEDQSSSARERRYEARMAQMQECLRSHRITHVILYGTDARTLNAIGRMISDTTQWYPLYLDGRTALFGWKDPKGSQRPGPLAALRYDAAGRAFGDVPENERIPEPQLQVLFGQWGLGRYLVAPPPRPVEADEALIHQLVFLSAADEYALRGEKLWHDTYPARLPACGAVGVASDGGVGPGLTALTLEAMRMRAAEWVFFPEQFRQPKRAPQELRFLQEARQVSIRQLLERLDAGPPEHALLAVRAARRATALEPEDATAWLRLVDAYQNLEAGTRARVWTNRTPALALLRRVQTIAALQAAVTLQPDSLEIHNRLANQYRQMGYLDLYRKHFVEVVRVVKEAGRLPEEPPEKFEVRKEDMDREVEKIDKALKEQQDLYLTASQGKLPLEQAQMALEHGLAESALATLQQASSLDLGVTGYQMQLELLLNLGRLEEVRGFGWQDARGSLGLLQTNAVSPQMPAAEWYRLLLAAASGEYAVARKELDALIAFDPPALQGLLASRQRGASLTSVLLTAGQVVPTAKPVAVTALESVERRLFSDVFLATCIGHIQQRADLLTIRGILALEAGDTKAAADDFRAALAVAPEFGARPAAERYLELIESARAK